MDKTRHKIINATLEEIEQSGLRATTKQIAKRAGVNELTLFRHFGTKEQLVIAAIRDNLALLLGDNQTVTGNIQADLEALAQQYVTLIDSYPGTVVALLSETDQKIVDALIAPLQRRIVATISHVMQAYIATGELEVTSDNDLIREFMGPLMARAFLVRAIKSNSFDALSYVRRFLTGHQQPIA